jgi:O-antigen ligase
MLRTIFRSKSLAWQGRNQDREGSCVNLSTYTNATNPEPRAHEIYGNALDGKAAVSAPNVEVSRTYSQPRRGQAYGFYHYVLLVYLFLYCSRIPELLPYFRFALIMQPILLIGLFQTNRVRALAQTRAGRYLIGFVIWMAICVPFSLWRGGSFTVLLQTARTLLLVAFIVAFNQTLRDYLRSIFVVGFAMGAAAALSFAVGQYQAGRLGLGETGSTLADANTLCLYVLLGLPFLYLSFTLSTGLRKYLSLASMVLILAAAARTASRAGLLTLVVGMLLFFVYGTAKQRVGVFACAILLMLGALLLPQRIRERFTTYFEANPSAEQSEAVGSAEARKYLLLRSLRMTAENPIFGVGPGQFMTGEAKMSKEEGVRASWHVSHNSYTEVSSEMGIPGLLLYLATLVSAYRGLVGLRKRGLNVQIRRTALSMQIALSMMLVGAFFLSVAYGGVFDPFLGLSIALPLAARR